MPATRFDGANDNIITSLGGLGSTLPFTNMTLMAIVRTPNTLSDGSWQATGPCIRANSTSARYGLERNTANQLTPGNDATTTSAAAATFSSGDGWSLIAVSHTNTNGGAPLIVCGSNLAGTITWKSGTGSTLAIPAASAQDVMFGEWGNLVDDLNGWLAAAAVFDQALTLAQIQECAANRRTSDIWNNSAGRPKALWQFNATGVTDLTGGGANETARSGTTIDAAETPPWSFDGLGGTSKVPVRLGTGGNPSGLTSNSLTTTAAVPAGGRVIVPVQWASDTTATTPIVSGGGLTFVRDYRTTATEGTVKYGIDYWSAYAQQGLPSGTTININFTPGAPYGLNVAAYYAMGLARGQSLDGTANVFRPSATATWTAGPITTTNANDLIMTTAFSDHATVLNSSTPLAGGFTELDDFWIGGTDWAMVNSYREVAATGTYTATGTWLNSPSFADFTAMVVYKAGSTEALDASNSEYGDGTYGKGAYGMRWESDPAVTSTWAGTVARRYLHMSNSPFNQTWTPATSALRHSAITLHGATAQPTDHNTIKTASPTTDVGFYVDLGYADNGTGLQTVFTAAECRLQGWLAYDQGAEFANPFGGDSVLVDLGAPGIAEGAVKRIKQKFADAITAGSSQAFDYVFLDDVNVQFIDMVNAAQVPDGYTSVADYSARAVVPTLKYIAQAMWNDGVKFVIPNLGDWVNLDVQTTAYTAVRSGFNEQSTNGVPRVNRSSGQLTRMYNVLRDAATNGNRVFLMTPLIDQNDTQTALYGWAYANIVGEPGTTYHAVAGPNGWYGYDSPVLTEHTVNLGAPLEGPQISGNLYSRHFTNYTVYANVGGTSVTIPADGSTLTALTGRFDALSTTTQKTASDSQGITDNAGAIAASAALTDAQTQSEGAAANLSNLLSRVDAWTLTDIAALAATLLVSATDTLTLTEGTSQVDLATSTTDVQTQSDASSLAPSVNVTDSAAQTEGTSSASATLDANDAQTMDDQSSAAPTVSANDTVTQSEGTTATSATLDANDAQTQGDVSTSAVTLSVTDSWTLTDLSALLATLVINTTDAWTFSDTSTLLTTLALAASETHATVDSSAVAAALTSAGDSWTVTELAAVLTAVDRQDSWAVTDLAAILSTLALSASDSWGVVDSSSLVASIVSVGDSWTESELSNVLATITAVDSWTAADVSNLLTTLALSASDSLTVSDFSAILATLAVSASDALTQDDASALAANATVAETHSQGDTSAVSADVVANETHTLTDIVAAISAGVDVNDSASVLDAALLTSTLQLSLSDSFALVFEHGDPVESAVPGYMQAVRTDSPRLYYPMSAGSATQPEDQGGPNLLLEGGATTGVSGATSALGPAVSFDGVNDAGRTATAVDFSNTDKITAEYWLKWFGYNNDDALSLEFGESNSLNGFAHDPSSSSADVAGGWAAFSKNETTGAFQEEQMARPPVNTWHHIVVEIDRGAATTIDQIKFFVDGAQTTSIQRGGAGSDMTGVFINNVFMVMARSGFGNGTRSLFGSGVMQHLAIYDYLLSPTRIQAHYDARNDAGGAIQKTASESFVAADVVTSISAAVATTDLGAFNDASAAFVSAVLSAIDSLSQTDASILSTIFQITASDNLTLSDLSSLSAALATTDVATAADAVLSLTSNLSAAEATLLLSELASYAAALTASDSSTADESLTITSLFNGSDTLTQDEASSLANAISATTDTATQTEVGNANLSALLDRADVLNVSEISAIAATLAALDSSILTDFVFSSGQQLSVTASDSWAVTELSALLTQNVISASDSLTQADLSALAVAAAANDALTLSDFAAINATMAASDDAALIEALVASAQFTRADSWTATEVSSALATLDLNDSLAVADVSALLANAIAADAAAISESLDVLANILRTDGQFFTEQAVELLLAKSAVDSWVMNAAAFLAEFAGEAPDLTLPTAAIISFIATAVAITQRQTFVEVVNAPQTGVEIVPQQTSVEVREQQTSATVTSRLTQTTVTP